MILKRFISSTIKVLTAIIAMWLISLQLYANTHNRIACGGPNAVITRDALFAGVPGGHTTTGVWEDRGGLNFTFLPDGNFWISGFVQGQTYTIRWRRNPGQLHTFIINVPVNAGSYTIRNEYGGTDDVLLCAGQYHDFLIGPATGTAYAKFRRDVVTNSITHVETNHLPGYRFTYPVGSTSAFEVFGLVTHSVSGNTCISRTNGIEVSEENLVLQVVGGGSVCGNPTPNVTLEVIPFDNSLSYTWRRDGAIIGTGRTVNTLGIAGTYTASTSACGRTITSNPAVLSNHGLTANISPSGNIPVCTGTTVLTGTGSSSAANPLEHVWLFNDFPGPGGGSGSSATLSTSNAGTYNFKVIEQGNPLCFAISPDVNLNMVGFSLNSFVSNGPVSFCGTITPAIDLNVSMTGATGLISVVITNVISGESRTFTVNHNVTTTVTMPDIAGNAEYRVTSISGGGCNAPGDMLLAIPSIFYTRQADPLVFNLTGAAGGCAGSTTVIGLSGSQLGIRYELLRDGLPLSPAVEIDGTGAPIASAFSVSNAGDYTVRARSGACPPVMMNGSRQVFVAPAVVNMVNTGLVCPSGEVRLNTSFTGITYHLFRNGVATGATRNGVSGSPISFGDQSIPGVYTVQASPGGNCFVAMTGQLTVQPQPSVFNLSANRLSYCASAPVSGVTITLGGSEPNITYRLFRGTTLISTVIGDGNPLQWHNQVAGTYTVRAYNDGGCDVLMSGSPNIVIAPLPTANIFVASATNRRCVNATAEFRIGITLTGTAPFTFDILNNAGLPVINVVNHPSNIFTPLLVSPNQTVTYTIANLRDANNCDAVNGTGSATFFVDPLPTITFNPEIPRLCAGGTPIAITALGAGPGGTYQWSDGLGNNQTINVSPPLTTTYNVTATTQHGCSANRSITVTVNPLPVVDFAPPGNDYSVCQNGGIITLTPSPAGGGFSGTGIIPFTNSFNPAVAGAGTHNITYTFEDANTCVNSITKSMIVTAPPAINITGLASSYCADDPDVLITGTPTNNRGTFELVGHAPGVMWQDNGNGTMTLSPSGIIGSGSGPGLYTVRFRYTDLNGCVSIMERTTTINEDLSGVVRFRGLPPVTCQTNPPITLQAYFERPPAPDADITTNDGSFSGPGITNTGNGSATFNPAAAGNGLHTVQYSYRDPVTGCRASYSLQVQVGTSITINGLTTTTFCSTDGPQSWYGTPATGRMAIYLNSVAPANLLAEKYNPTAIDPFSFNPSVAGPGTYILVYEHVDVSGCSNILTRTITVGTVLDARFTTAGGLTQFCRHAPLVTLQPALGASPGGFYTGPGVSGNRFNPSVAGVGVHVIRRTVATPTCSDIEELTITVVGDENIWLDNLASQYCVNATGPFRVDVNNPGVTGAVYTISSTLNAIGRSPLYVIDGGGNRIYQTSHLSQHVFFDPGRVGVGTYFITYRFDNTVNNGCVTTFTRRVDVVAAPEVNFGGLTDPVIYCQDGGIITLTGSFVSGGFTGSGDFSGAGIDNGVPGDGIATFNPMLVTPGDHPVTYTYQNPAGCVTTRTRIFTVRQSPLIYEITPKDTPGGFFCATGPGVSVGVENSQTGVNYQLILNNNLASPVQTIAGTGIAISFSPVNVPGNYTVRAVAVAGGCTSMMTGVVEVRASNVAAAISRQHVSCRGGNDGQITINASGGVAPYTYRLSTDGGVTFTNFPSNVISNLAARGYHVQVVDANGCQLGVPVAVAIGEPAITLSGVTSSSAAGCVPCTPGVDCEGMASVVISGGTPFSNLVAYPSGYDIEWRDAANNLIGNTPSIVNQPPGFYTVSVSDANGCSFNRVVEISQVPPIVLGEVAASRVNVSCNGAATGVIEVVATGGAAGANYQFSLDGVNWLSPNVGSAGRRFTGLVAGSYMIWARDANYPRCVYSLTTPIVLTQPDALTLSVINLQHVACHGQNSGIIEVLAQGGAGGYQYSLNGAAWGALPRFDNLPAGVYNISVRDNNNCIFNSMLPVQVNQPANPLSAHVTLLSGVTCNGGNNGAVRVDAVGGTLPYSYSWQRVGDPMWADAGQQPSSLVAGTYSVVVTDGAGCSFTSSSIVVPQPATPISLSIPVAGVVHVDCAGAATGSFSVSVLPSGVYEFSTDNGATWVTSNHFQGLNAGSYSVSVRNMAGCTVMNGASVTINEPAPLLLSLAVTDVTCHGQTNGSVVVNVAGGNLSGAVNYVLYRRNIHGVWTVFNSATIASPPFNTHTFSSLAQGDYQVRVVDGNGCELTAGFVVNQPLAWTVVHDVQPVSLSGSSDGRILVNNITGAPGPYLVELFQVGAVTPLANQTGFSAAFNSLPAGDYRVLITAANGCFQELLLTITQPGDLVADIDVMPVSCTGYADGRITVSVISGTGPFVIRWQAALPDGTTIDQTVNTSLGNYAINGLRAGGYLVTITDNLGDVVTLTVNLTEPWPASLIATGNDISCFGQSDGTASINLVTARDIAQVNGYRVVWSGPGIAINDLYGNPSSRNLSGLGRGVYNVAVIDLNGCVFGAQVNIVEPSRIVVNLESSRDLTCYNLNDGTIEVSVAGRPGGTTYNFSWQMHVGGPLDVDASWAPYPGSVNLPVIQDLPPGIYRVRVVEQATGCAGVSAPVRINQPGELQLVQVGSTRHVTTCAGQATGEVYISVAGGVAPFVINYGTISSNWNGIGVYNATGLAAGNYLFEITDATGCQDQLPITVNEPQPLVISGFDYGIRCDVPSSGYVSFNVSGGREVAGSFAYHARLVRVENNQVFFNGILSSAINNPLPVPLVEGTYVLRIVDANSTGPMACLFEQQFVLRGVRVVSTVSNPVCAGQDNGRISLDVNGGSGNFSFSWTGPSGFTANTPVIDNLAPGSYTVRVSDLDEGCFIDRSFNVVYSSVLNVSVSRGNVSCYAGNTGSVAALAGGGTGPYNFLWEQFTGTGWIPVMHAPAIANLGAGTYRVTVTDSNGCQVISPDVVLTQPADFSLDPAPLVTHVSCNGGTNGSFTVTPNRTGNFEYSIDGVNWQVSPTFTGLAAGGYQVSMRDRDTGPPFCTRHDILDVVIIEPGQLNVLLDNITNVTCFGATDGSVTVSVSGGVPAYSLQWFRVTGTGNIPLAGNGTALGAGDYRVRVTDLNSCVVTSPVFRVSGPASLPSVNVISNIPASAPGLQNGRIVVNIQGGTPGYLISWTGPAGFTAGNVTSLNNLGAGTYTITVIDVNNCPVSRDIIVSEPGTPLSLDVLAVDPGPCNGATNGQIELIASGGVLPYTFTLVRYPATEVATITSSAGYAVYTNLAPGYFEAIVTDANGVVVSVRDIVLADPAAFELFIFNKVNVTCHGLTDGRITFRAEGGTGGTFDYVLLPPLGAAVTGSIAAGSNLDLTGLGAGHHTITVIDGAGCYQVGHFEITQPAPVIIQGTLANVTCAGGNNGIITVSVTGGSGPGIPFEYTWSRYGATGWEVIAGADSRTLRDAVAGRYRVQVVEQFGAFCAALSDEFIIGEPSPVVANLSVFNVNSCTGDNTGRIEVNVHGGVAPYAVNNGLQTLFGNGPGFVFDNLYPGPYVIVVTDRDGTGCQVVHNVVIDQPVAPLSISGFTTGVTCTDVSTGREQFLISFTLSGGVADATGVYRREARVVDLATSAVRVANFSGGASENVNLNNLDLPAGRYRITVTDLNASPSPNCPQPSLDFELTRVTVTAAVTNATCPGINNGAINVEVNGGSGNFSYSWGNAADPAFNETTQDLSGVPAGTYTLLITDLGQPQRCPISRTFQVSHNRTLTIEHAIEPVSCFGGNNGVIRVTGVANAAPGLSYFWNGSTVAGSSVLTGLTTGSYTVTVVDGDGCSVTGNFTVPQPAQPISFDLVSSLDCSGNQRVISIANLAGGTGPFSPSGFTWGGEGAFSRDPGGESIRGIVTGGQYTLTVSDARGCNASRNITLYGNIILSAQVSNVTCNGGSDGNIILNVVGGSNALTFSWTLQGDPLFARGTKDISNLIAGRYTVVVSDPLQPCISGGFYSTSLVVDVAGPAPLVIDGNVTHITCNGDATGRINLHTLSGGVVPYSFAWTTTNGSGLDITARNQSGLTAGTYTVRVTDGNGCVSPPVSFTVNQPDALFFNLAVDDTNCANNNRVEIISHGGGSGPYAFVWDGPGATVGTDFLKTNLPGGTYNITMIDMGSPGRCNITRTVVLTTPLAVNAVVKPETCPGTNDGAITLDVTGGTWPYSFAWDPAPGINVNERVQAALPAGTYNVTITDNRAGGACVFTLPVTVPFRHSIDIQAAIDNVECYGGTNGAIHLSVFNGSGNYSYQWVRGSFTANTRDLTNITAGDYTVNVTDLVYGCTMTRTFTVTQPSDPIRVQVDNITPNLCFGDRNGAIDITITGGTAPYQFAWSGPGNLAMPGSEDQSGLASGDYHLTVTDANGCTLFNHGPISLPGPAAPITVEVVAVLPVSATGAANGSISVSVSGGTGSYSILWFDAANNQLTAFNNLSFASGLPGGNYRVVVQDANGCIAEVSVHVHEPGQPLGLIIEKINNGPCAGISNGQLFVTITGGQLPYQYLRLRLGATLVGQYSNVNSARFNHLAAGDYIVEARDALNNVVTRTVSILAPLAQLTVNAAVSQHLACRDLATGVITARVTGGVASDAGTYLLLLSGGPAGTSATAMVQAGVDFQFTGLPAGNYIVSVIDDSNPLRVADSVNDIPSAYGDNLFNTGFDCFAASAALTVMQPEARVTISAEPGSEELCYGQNPRLVLNTSGWNFASPLAVTLSNGDVVIVNSSTHLHVVAASPTNLVTNFSILSVTSGGCPVGTGLGTATVLTRQLPTAAISGATTICSGGTARLELNLTGAGPWNVEYMDNLGNIFIESGIVASPHSIHLQPLVSTTYTLRSVSDLHCQGTVSGSATVTVEPVATVELVGSAGFNQVCGFDSFPLRFRFNPLAGGPWQVTYREDRLHNGLPSGVFTDRSIVVLPAMLNSDNEYVVVVNPSHPVRYTILSITSGGCNGIVQGLPLDIMVRDLPGQPGLMSGPVVVCQGQSVTYTVPPLQNVSHYIWTLPDGTAISGTNSITINFAADANSGRLSVFGVNDCGNGPVRYIDIVISPLPAAAGMMIHGQSDICQGQTRVPFYVDVVPHATSYDWTLPHGWSFTGDGSRNILVDVPVNLVSFTGNITVAPINACGVATAPISLQVQVRPNPVVNAGIDQIALCESFTTLGATPPQPGETGSWTIQQGSATIVDINDPLSQVTGISRGNVILRWTVATNAYGCSAFDEVTIRNNQLSVDAVTDNSSVCQGTAIVRGTPGNQSLGISGRWSVVTPAGSLATFDDVAGPVTAVRNLATGTNRLRWTLTQNGCDSFNEVAIVNNQVGPVTINGFPNPSPIDLPCGDTAVTLGGSTAGAGTGTWSVARGVGHFSDVSSSVVTVSNIAQGVNEFVWTVTNGGCSQSASVIVRNNMLTVSAGVPRAVCTNSVVLNGSVHTGPGITSEWVAPTGVVLSNSANPAATATNLLPDGNLFTWRVNNNGCVSQAQVLITNNTPTQATVGVDQTTCGNAVTLSGNEPLHGSTGRWSVVTGSGDFSNLALHNTVVDNIGQGVNIFRWTTSKGTCSSHADIRVVNRSIVVDAGKDFVTCNRIVTLTGTPVPPGMQGRWQVVTGGATIPAATQGSNVVTVGVDPGLNVFRWTITDNSVIGSPCTSFDDVTVFNSAAVNVRIVGGNRIVGSETVLVAEPPGGTSTGSWQLVAGGADIQVIDPLTIRVTNLRRGENVFRWTVVNGQCSEYVEVTVTNGGVIQANAGTDQVVCDNFTRLDANDPQEGIGEWTVVYGSGVFENRHDRRSRVSFLSPGDNIFRWTIRYATNFTSDEVTITNNRPAQANAGNDDILCNNQVQLRGNVPGFDMGTGVWTLIEGGGTILNPNLAVTEVVDLANGVNLFRYTITKGQGLAACTSVDFVTIVNGLPTQADAGVDNVVTICEDFFQLKPNTPTYGTASWVLGTVGRASFEGNWVRNLAPGPNELIYRIATEHCSSEDVVVVINNKPSDAFAGIDRDICVDNINLSAATPLEGVGMWERVTGSGVIQDVTATGTMVTGLARGSNHFRWTVTKGACTSVDEVIINNNYVPSTAGPNMVLCANSATLMASNPLPGVGTWGVSGGSGRANFANATDPLTTVTNLDQGDNVLTWTVNHRGCVSVSTVTITNNLPTPANAGPDLALCFANATLAANQPSVGTGQWTIVNGGGDFAINPSTTNPAVTPMTDPSAVVSNLPFGVNMFRWTIRNQDCLSFDDVVVEYNRIEANAGLPRTICSSSTVLEANSPLPGIGLWSVPGGQGAATFENINSPTTRVSNLRRGDNTLRWSIIHKGCVTHHDVVITNSLPGEAFAGNTQMLCASETTLDATAPAVGTGFWQVVTGAGVFDDQTRHNARVTGLAQGDNLFVWTTVNGACTLEDQVLVRNDQPSEPYAGSGFEEVCTNTIQLRAATPDYGQGAWSIIEGGGNISNPFEPRATVTFLNPGANRFRWTVSAGNCSRHAEVVIQNNTPTAANAGPDIHDCKNWHNLDANIPLHGTGRWERVSGNGVFDNPANAKTTVRDLGFGENIFRWVISNGGCTTSDLVTVFNRIPDMAFAGSDQVICQDYTSLNANDPVTGTGRWRVIRGMGQFVDSTSFNTVVRGVGFGENIYRWEVAYGECFTHDEVVVVSHKAHAYAGEDQVVYENRALLNANNSGIPGNRWVVVGTTPAQFNDANFFNTAVTNLSPGINTFRWEIDVNGCIAYDLVSIDYRVVPDAQFIVDSSEGCFPLTVRFTNYSVGGSIYLWDFGDGNTSNLRNPVHTFVSPGRYNVRLIAPGPDGRDGVYQREIIARDHPIANFTVNPQIVYVPGDRARFYDLSTDAVTWDWDFGDGATSTERNPSHQYYNQGVFDVRLVVSNAFGCRDTIMVNDVITAEPQGFVILPNAFRPRPGSNPNQPGDPSSEYVSVFKPAHRDVETFLMQIFNRWGQLIFETTDIETGWDGMHQGQLAPQAVYVYRVSGRFINGREFRETGSVLLVR